MNDYETRKGRVAVERLFHNQLFSGPDPPEQRIVKVSGNKNYIIFFIKNNTSDP